MAWDVLSRKKLLDKWPHIRVYREKIKTEKGTVVDDYHQLEAVSFSIIFPLMADGRIGLVRHYRHAVGRVVYDLPGGGIEDNETPLQCAQRELREETGLTAPHWEHLGTYKLSQVRGIADAHLYLASEAKRTHPIEQDALSPTSLHPVTKDALLTMWRDGEWAIITTGALVALGLGHLGVL